MNHSAFLHLSSNAILAIALIAAGAASLLIGAALIIRARSLNKQAKRLDAAVAARSGTTLERTQSEGVRSKLVALGIRGVASSLGQTLVAEEDRALLDQCGADTPAGRAYFFLARVVLGIGLPIAGLFYFEGGSLVRTVMTIFFGFAVGYMGPKWYLGRRAAERRRLADAEMPLLVDLLRLLQGVGLSIDQAIQMIEQDFAGSMPVLVSELSHASAQYRTGQSRELSMQRFATVYRNDDMASIAELIVQVDKFGGGVQEPLRQFGDRMRERRRMDMKAKIGRLTVKMTAVMVVTLLPALMIVTGGAGFLAIIRGLSKINAS